MQSAKVLVQVRSAVTGKCNVCFVTAPFIPLVHRKIAGGLIVFGAKRLLCYLHECCTNYSYVYQEQGLEPEPLCGIVVAVSIHLGQLSASFIVLVSTRIGIVKVISAGGKPDKKDCELH